MKIFSHRLIELSPVPAYLTGMIVSSIWFFTYLMIARDAGLVGQTLSGDVSSIELRASLTLMVMMVIFMSMTGHLAFRPGRGILL